MPGISKNTFQFLKELKKNNNREWFAGNKPRYEQSKAEFEIFVDALIAKIAEYDAGIASIKAKDCVFRIYRDIRFSKDKSPYKTHFGAHITSAAKKTEVHSRAGYYVHIGPGESMLAGGAYMPESTWLKAIRQEIHYNSGEFKKILSSKSFRQYFGEMEGEKLKTTPKDYPPDHPDIELLKHKSFLAAHHLNDSDVTAADFLKRAVSIFKALYPFDRFLNSALD